MGAKDSWIGGDKLIEIRIPKEITSYKEKLVFGLTVRQFITTTIALAINIPLYIYGRDYIGDEAMSWIIILTTLPLASIGFFKYNGMTFEKFLYVLFQYMVYPQKRTYQIKSFWVTFDTNYEKLMNMAYEIDNGKREYRKRVKSEKKEEKLRVKEERKRLKADKKAMKDLGIMSKKQNKNKFKSEELEKKKTNLKKQKIKN